MVFDYNTQQHIEDHIVTFTKMQRKEWRRKQNAYSSVPNFLVRNVISNAKFCSWVNHTVHNTKVCTITLPAVMFTAEPVCSHQCRKWITHLPVQSGFENYVQFVLYHTKLSFITKFILLTTETFKKDLIAHLELWFPIKLFWLHWWPYWLPFRALNSLSFTLGSRTSSNSVQVHAMEEHF